MSEKLWRWFAAEIGPRLPIIRISSIGIWSEPGDRLCRAEVLLFGFIITLLLAGCAPEPVPIRCVEINTGREVFALEKIQQWQRIYVYPDDNGLDQVINSKNSHMWRCEAAR